MKHYNLLALVAIVSLSASCSTGSVEGNNQAAAKENIHDSLSLDSVGYAPPFQIPDSAAEMTEVMAGKSLLDESIIKNDTLITYNNEEYIFRKYNVVYKHRSFRISCYDNGKKVYALIKASVMDFSYKSGSLILMMEINGPRMSIVSVGDDTIPSNEKFLSQIKRAMRKKWSYPKVRLDDEGVVEEMRYLPWHGEFQIGYNSKEMWLKNIDNNRTVFKSAIWVPYVNKAVCEYFTSTLDKRLPPFKLVELDKFGYYFIEKEPFGFDFTEKCPDSIFSEEELLYFKTYPDSRDY